MTLTNSDLMKKAEQAEYNCDWIEALYYYHEVILNTNNQDLIRACCEDIAALNLIIDSIAIGDAMRAREHTQ